MALRNNDSLYRYIRNFQIAYPGCAPSYREIGDAFGLSTSMVSYYIKQLVEDGLLVVHGEGQSRSISVDGYFFTFRELERLGVDKSKARELQQLAKAELKRAMEHGGMG